MQLNTPDYKRDGYGFAGWNTNSSGTGTNYGPEETMTVTASSYKKIINLYANWKASAGNMQNWTGCSSLAKGSVTALKDTRDNQVYAVAKLADGKCWMIENLRLNNSATLNTSNTDFPSGGMVYFSKLLTSSDNWCTDTTTTYHNRAMINTTNTTNTEATMTYKGDNVYSYGNYYN